MYQTPSLPLSSLLVIAVGAVVALGIPSTAVAAVDLCGDQPPTVVGTEGDDHLVGTEGDDVIGGLGGNDLIEGLGGNDTICGGEGSDDLRGGDGNDGLRSGPNAFDSSGYPIPEDLWGGMGDDYITGGEGGEPQDIDRVHYDDAPGPVEVNLDFFGAAYQAFGEGKDQIYQVEEIYGSQFDDSLSGLGAKFANDSRFAKPYVPDDRLFGLGGDDHLFGLEGRDELVGGAGDDWIEGGPGDDGIHGGADNDTMSGGSENDFMDGDNGNDTIGGNEGYDSLDGGTGDDELLGGSQGDTLSDPDGVDIADGGPASDDCTLAFETSQSCETFFDDTAPSPIARATVGRHLAAESPLTFDSLTRDSQSRAVPPDSCKGKNATIVGTNTGDVINGTGGRDVIATGKGPDVIHAGGGNDLICAGKGGDLLHGDKGDDKLFAGEDGYNPASEENEPDELWGGPGADQFDVGDSSLPNPIHLDDSPNPIEVRGAKITGFGNDRILKGTQIVGSDFDDVMTSFAETRWFLGGLGNDRLNGGAGLDILDGQEGDDTVVAGSGDDRIYGEFGNDRLAGGDGVDEFYLSGGVNDVSGGFDNDAFVAFAGDNTMAGGPGDDSFFGGVGVDTVDGGPHLSGDVCYQWLESTTDCEFQRFSRYHQI